MTKIRNVEELAAAIGAAHNTIESISRVIYKGTDCGAWVDTRNVGRTRTVRFKVVFGDSIYGPVAHHWQRAGRGPWHRTSDLTMPRELRQYIGGPEPKMVGPYRYDSMGNMLKVEGDAKTLAELREHTIGNDTIQWLPRKQTTAWITLNVTTTRPGVGIGSIVEGVDWTTETEELAFPFTSKQFWAAVQHVEDAAKDIWHETHGCEACGEENPETGYREVNPDCKACGGHGEVI